MSKSGIYGLLDPRTGQLRYVGFAFDFSVRLAHHCSPSRLRSSCHKNNWIKSLAKVNLRPMLAVIEHIELTGDSVLDVKTLGEAEMFWIASFRASGAQLINQTDGGEGRPGPHEPHSEETKAKIASALKGRPCSDVVKAKLSASLKGRSRKFTEEHLTNLRNAWRRPRKKRGPMPEEHKAKLRGPRKPVGPQSTEHKARLSEALIRFHEEKGSLLP